MNLMTKPRETRGLLRVGFAVVCVVVGLATCASALALRLDVNEPPPPPATASAANNPITMASGKVAGNRISGANPTYPADARAAHLSGTVALHAIISKTGAISELQVISGPKELRASAIDAVRTWRYRPFLLNGEPTAVETTIHVNYSIGN